MPKLLTTWGLVMLLATSSLLTTQVLVPAGQIDSRPTRSAGKTPASAPAEPAPEVSVIDVALATGHTLAGRVVDTQGQPRAAAVVTLVRGRRVIAHARTDRSGRYALTNLAGGLYQLKVDDTLQLVRAWEAGTAPGLSQSSVEVVADPGYRLLDPLVPHTMCQLPRQPRV